MKMTITNTRSGYSKNISLKLLKKYEKNLEN